MTHPRLAFRLSTLCLAALLLAGAAVPRVSGQAAAYGVAREIWRDLSTNSFAYADGAGFLSTPATTNLATAISSFSTPSSGNGYGQRLRAFILPPVTGPYSFAIASDDWSELYLSTDETPEKRRRIAFTPVTTPLRDYEFLASQDSGPIQLTAGVRYYIEAIHREGFGSDYLDVRWILPDETEESPIASRPSGKAARLIPFRTNTIVAPAFLVHPSNQPPVLEGRSIKYSLLVSNQSPVTYQWQQNSVDIPGATLPYLSLPAVTESANGGRKYRCVVSNSAGSTPSAEATLTVAPDAVAPIVTGVLVMGLDGLQVTFSEPIQSAVPSHYTIAGVVVQTAQLSAGGLQVTLKTSPHVLGSSHTLKIAGPVDLAGLPVAPGTQVDYTVQQFYSTAVGSTNSLGSVTAVGAQGFDMTAGGRELAGRTDQFLYQWSLVSGDFDFQVRVESMDLTDLLAKAGLMARDDLSSTGRYAAVLSTPSLNGVVFQYRSISGRDTTVAGGGVANFPNTWLRLQRVGNVISGFSSVDSRNWQPLGSMTGVLPESMFVGMAGNSRNADQSAVMRFRDFASVKGAPIGRSLPALREPPGPSSRRGPIVISEIMYHPPARLDQRDLEFVELFNSQPFFEDISGFRLSGDIDFTFPTNTLLPGGGYLVVARNPADLESVYGLKGVFGPYSNNIPNNIGVVRLRNELGGIVQEVEFNTAFPWPVSPDGAGHSLVLARPSYGEANVLAWAASDVRGGSPGRFDGVSADALDGIVFNEFLANPAAGQVEFLELFNPGNAEIDLSGAWLSDSAAVDKYAIPAGTRIPARGYLAFTSAQTGFSISSQGEALFLVNPSQTKVIDSIRFQGSSRGVSQGRPVEVDREFVELASPTPGAANSAALRRPVVISEIMYAPVSGDNDDEFLELHNRGSQPVSLSGWKLGSGVTFTFPDAASIPAHGYVVIAKNLARLLANYPNLTPANAFGNFGGTLANSGERVELLMAETSFSTNGFGRVSTNVAYVLVNQVTYSDGGRWSEWADGGGSSLELTDVNSDNRQAANWAGSDETAKAQWTNVEFTGRVDLGQMETPAMLQLFLQDAGEALIDDVEVAVVGGTNVVRNGGFESGTTGWTFQGTHEETLLETREGYGGSKQSLHIRASARGDNGGNRIRTSWGTPIPNNAIATIRAKVRWLAGTPHILLRLRGNYLECPGVMAVPRNLGTPGAPNSRAVANAAPAVFDVTHSPILPDAGEPVRITARVSDADGVGSLVMKWRIDGASGAPTYLDVLMKDDGSGGDEVAGDGLFSGTLPGQPANIMVAYYLVATDAATAASSRTFPEDAPVRECLIRFGEPQISGSALGSYRIWCTAATVTKWRNRGKQSNHPFDCTFVYGNHRLVYNARTLYSGSPWHTPGYGGPAGTDPVCDYVLRAPADDLVLGTTDFVLASIGNTDNDASKLAEQSSYWIARKMGIPYNHRRHFFMYFNGARRASSVYEDTQQPSSEVIKQYWPNDDTGPLHKIEDWFEFDDSGDNKTGNIDATLDNFTTLEGKKVARYRVCWRPRSLSAGENPNDFSELFKVVDALNSAQPEPYNTSLPSVMDVDAWLRVFAMQHIVGNWDSYGYNRGKNMYAYKPTQEGWKLLLWDIDFDVGSGGDGPETDLFVTNEPVISRLYANPLFRRMYLRICEEAAQGPLVAANFTPTLDAKYKALVDNGAAPTSVQFIKDFVQARRNNILNTVLPKTNFTVYTSSTLSTNVNFLTLTGAAPVKVESIAVNGVRYPLSWATVGGRPIYWSFQVPLQAGTNRLEITALDRFGNTVSNGVQTVEALYTGPVAVPEGNVVISELSYSPSDPASGFIEIHNRSKTSGFDLSGWRLSGVDYDFAEGIFIHPDEYIVVARDFFAFGARFGLRVPVLGQFSGNLDPEGETLTLLRPGSAPGQYEVVDRIRYEAAAPWLQSPIVEGGSLEVVDQSRDNARVSNWADQGDGWRFVSVTGKPGSSNLFLYFNGTGDAYIDDISLVAGEIPAAGQNLLRNGGFEEPLGTVWKVPTSHSKSEISTSVFRKGASSLHIVASSSGSATTNASITQPGVSLTISNLYTLSFWMRYGDSATAAGLVSRFTPGTLGTTQLVARVFGTPGLANLTTGSLPEYPSLWLNEVQPVNAKGLVVDPQGDKDPWVEILNTGTTPVSLDGFFLSDSYSNLGAWPFPAGAVIQPGEMKVVWLDGDPDDTTSRDWHTSFRASPAAGSVALSRRLEGSFQILDYLNYIDMKSDESYGSFPDGQPFYRQVMSFASPGKVNDGSSAPLDVRINEWMASNTGFIRDTADLPPAADDWFELYNSGRNEADLGGYYLTDNSKNKTLYRIPDGTRIPAGKYLLVWADNSPGQNSTNSTDLHTNFQLARAGEEIGLFGPDGATVDLVSFGSQTNNVSQGRLPDGGSTIVFFEQPTPRSANRLSGRNTAPVLARVGDRSVDERRRLTLQLSATDAEENADQLVFSLAPGAPAGASITPRGEFVWRPSEAQGPGLVSVTFRVNDNGSPSLQASETIQISVKEINQPPVFVDLRTRFARVGEALSFSTAVDYDLPAQSVSYRLESAAPDGLLLSPATGIVSWTPQSIHAGQTFTVAVVATDSGAPTLTSRASYQITVSRDGDTVIVLRPQLEGNQISIRWDSAPGDRYQVEFQSGLGGEWTSLGDVVVATGATTVAKDALGTTRGRFYRVRKL